MSGYDNLGGGRPRMVRDHTAAWNRLRPITDPQARSEVEAFCERKRITVAALEALGARVAKNPGAFGKSVVGWCLAYAGRSNGQVTAVKYRPLNQDSHASVSETGSWWINPIVVGNRASLDWLIAEGETEAARLYGLAGDRCAILALPTGAKTFRREWAGPIPRDARTGLCHDNDEDGDEGAELAARVMGGRTFRVPSPVEGGDWCDWEGDAEEFAQLVWLAQQQQQQEMHAVTLEEFTSTDEPGAAALLGESEDAALIPEGSDGMVYGDGGAGKTTLMVDLALHLGAGQDWLGVEVARPVNVLLIENEGPRPMFRRKLRRKLEAWSGRPVEGRVHVFERPWRQFTFAVEGWRAELARVVAEREIDVVIVGPLTRIGMDGAGTLHEVAAFMGLVEDVRGMLDRPLAVVLVHHENKGGAVSGAWEGSGDTLLHVRGAGNGHTIVFIQKARWDRERHGSTLKLAWTEAEGYELEGEERDLLAEVDEFFVERGWSTIREISAPKRAKKGHMPGVGARQEDVRHLLTDPDQAGRFVSCTGADAKALDRSPRAVLWNRSGALGSVGSVPLFGVPPGTETKEVIQ